MLVQVSRAFWQPVVRRPTSTRRHLTGLSHLYITDVDGSSKKVTYIDTAAHGAQHNHQLNPNSPPLVFLMGTAQTIPAYAANINALSMKHRVIIFELRGQGTTELDSSHCTTEQQVHDLHAMLRKIVGVDAPVHLSGYSFGGRIALAYAAHHPHQVDRLSVTGVPLTRSATGRLLVRSWEDALSRGNLRECAWSLVLNGYSDEMLTKMEKRIGTNVNYIVESNDVRRLHDLIRLSHEKDPQSTYAVHNSVKHVRCPTQIIAGRHDRIAGYDETLMLAKAIPNAELVAFDAGHSIPFEKTAQWCRTVSEFMHK